MLVKIVFFLSVVILLTFLLGGATKGYAQQEWKYLTSNVNGDSIYVAHKKKIRDGVYRVWLRQVNSMADTATNENRGTTAKETLSYDEYDCNEERSRNLEFTIYLADGHPTGADAKNEPGNWSYVVPGTVLLQYACRNQSSKTRIK